MTEKIIYYTIMALIIGVSLSYLNKAGGKIIEANNKGETLIGMNKLYLIVGYISIAIGLFVILVPFFFDEWDIGIIISMILFLIFFGGAGFIMILFYRNHQVLFDNKKIEVRNVFGKTKTTTWNKITKASFNQNSSMITFVDYEGQKLKVHQHLVGIGKLIGFMEDNTEWTAKRLKLPVERSKAEII